MPASTFRLKTGMTIEGPFATPNSDVDIYSGSGSPEGVTTANPGSLFLDYTNGKLYVKETGTGNTGWGTTSSTTLLDGKNSVRVATQYALPAYSGTGTGTLTGTIPNEFLPKDGITLLANDDVLVKNENGTSADLDNGIYTLTTLGVDSTAEVSSVDTIAASGITTGDYFAISTPANTYWVWYNKDAGGGAPTPTTEILVEVAIVTADTASQVATKTKTALDAVNDFVNAGGAVFTTGIANGNELTITNNQGGAATDAVDGTAATGFTIATDTQGANDGTSWVLTRRDDANSSAEVTANMYCYIEEGTQYGSTGWLLSTDDVITLNTTPLQFIQFTGPGLYVAGNGITISGTTISVNLDATSGLEFNSGALRINVDATNNTTNLNAANEIEVTGYAKKTGTAVNATSYVTIDSFTMSAEGESAQWLVEIIDGTTPANREYAIINAVCDGGTTVDYNVYSKLKVGALTIKADFQVIAAAGVMSLQIDCSGTSQADIDYVLTRISNTII